MNAMPTHRSKPWYSAIPYAFTFAAAAVSIGTGLQALIAR